MGRREDKKGDREVERNEQLNTIVKQRTIERESFVLSSFSADVKAVHVVLKPVEAKMNNQVQLHVV